MKYKVGDKVIITKEKRSGSWNSSGQMDHRLGKTMTIREVNDDDYIMEEDGGEYFGSGRFRYEDMIEGLAEEFKEGEVVLVRDNKEITEEKRIYLCTIPGNLEYKYVCIEDGYEEKYKNGEEIEIIRRKNIKKLPKKESGTSSNQVNIELTEEDLVILIKASMRLLALKDKLIGSLSPKE